MSTSQSQAKDVFLPRRGVLVSNLKSSQVARSTVATTWRWLWPDVLMRIVPLTVIPLIVIALLHLPLSSLGLTPGNWPLQLVSGLLIGLAMACFATTYRILVFFFNDTPTT